MAFVARLVESDRLPYLTVSAWLLDQTSRVTEAGECKGKVLADECMSVVLAHDICVPLAARRIEYAVMLLLQIARLSCSHVG